MFSLINLLACFPPDVLLKSHPSSTVKDVDEAIEYGLKFAKQRADRHVKKCDGRLVLKGFYVLSLIYVNKIRHVKTFVSFLICFHGNKR